MQANNREDEAQTQNQDNNGVHAETGALISVELEHGAGGATGASRAGGARTGIAQSLLVVGSSTTAHGSARTAGGSGRGGTVDGGTGGGSDSSAGGLGVGARLSARGERGGGTGGGLYGDGGLDGCWIS